jgi:hypothetical protein
MWWHIFLSGSAGSVADMMQPRNSSRNSLISFSSLSSLRRKAVDAYSLAGVLDVMTICQPVLGIRLRSLIWMFLGLPDPDPLVRGMFRILPFSHKGVERTEIMLAK